MLLHSDPLIADLSCTRAGVTEDLAKWNPHPRHVPTDSEVKSTYALIRRDDELISTLLSRVDHVTSILHELEDQLALVRQARLNKVAFISPCRRIPFEILGEIFALSMENIQSYSRVCRTWNHVVMNTSKLWSSLKISLMDHTGRFKGEKRLAGRWQKANTSRKLRDCLVRAGETDELHINLGVLNAPRQIQPDDEEMLKLLRATLPRWTEVELAINRRENILHDLKSWNSLRQLSVQFLRPVDAKSFEPFFQSIDTSAPRLRVLHLQNTLRGLSPSLPNVFPRLTSLSLQDCSLRILAYNNWESLQHLLLHNCTGGLKDMDPSPLTNDASFPMLKYLSINKTPTDILEHYRLPRLRALLILDAEITLHATITLEELETLELHLHCTQMPVLNYLQAPRLISFELKQLEAGDLSTTPPSTLLTSFFKSIARGTGEEVYYLRFLVINDVILDPDILEAILRGSPDISVVRVVPILLSSAQRLSWLKEKRTDGMLVAPKLEDLKIRILPHSLAGKEEAEISLRKELDFIEEQRSSTPHPLSLKIFRNIVK